MRGSKRQTSSRRRFIRLLSSAGAFAGLSLGLLPNVSRAAGRQGTTMTLPGDKLASRFLVHNERPWALETARSSFSIGPITPRANFFVRNNLPMPDPTVLDDPDSWTFNVKGVAREGLVTLAELRRLPTVTMASVIQCSGNGRAFFPHDPSGSPWGVGAAGCALWTGVEVQALIEARGGVRGEPTFLTAAGGDGLPPGVPREQVVVERSVPLAKGLKDCFLAWEMNGAPIDLVHGGPLRLIVPGYFGVNNVKWVQSLDLSQRESSARIQVSGYRVRQIGEQGAASHPSMWRMPVKSWINGPGADGEAIQAGRLVLHGYALSGERGVDRVEVAALPANYQAGVPLDWQPAHFLGPDLGPNAWRAFAFEQEVPAGVHRFVSRAYDVFGEVQPEMRQDNHRGYGHNGWFDHALSLTAVADLPSATAEQILDRQITPLAGSPEAGTLTSDMALSSGVALSPGVALSAQAELGKDVFLRRALPGCGVCHSLTDANAIATVGPNLDVLRPNAAQTMAAVTQGLGAMPAFADSLTPEEISAVAAYIEERAGR